MLPKSEQEVFERQEAPDRFDGDNARRILEQAVAEQHRLHKESDDTYSTRELEEMAAEAGISRQALLAAIQSTSGGVRILRRRSGKSWFRANAGIVLACVAAVVLIGLIIAFPTFAYVIFWIGIVLGLLILLGASPV